MNKNKDIVFTRQCISLIFLWYDNNFQDENNNLLDEKLICFFLISAQNNHMKGPGMSRLVRKPAFCICENKEADQLRG